MWHGKVLNLSYLRLGCEALVTETPPKQYLSPNLLQAIRRIPKEKQWVLLLYPPENKIFVARYAEFFDTYLITQEASGSTVEFDEIQREDAQPSKNTSQHQHEVKHDAIDTQTDMDTSKCGTIPMQPNVDLSKSQGPSTPAEVKPMKEIPYVSAVGSIMYAVRCTRPDVAFSQNLTSRYQHNPGKCYWTVVKNILKYLRNTKDMFLVYSDDSTTKLSVTCYIDASWETDRDDL
ncbi:hypothetical protein Tco_0835348 [Tanacetum coccineum]